MPEGVHPYPRWNGRLATTTRVWTVAGGEVDRVRRSTWTSLVFLLGLAWGVASVIELWQLRRDGTSVHEWAWFVDMLDQLRWFALAFAAAAGGPALLDDLRLGALELYLTRPLTARAYVVGKALALLGMTTAIMVVPSVLYIAASHGLYDDHPERWGRALPMAILYGVAWGILVSGVALGLSAVGRSARAMAIAILGAFVGADIVVGRLLSQLTQDDLFRLASPFESHQALGTFLFPAGVSVPFDPLWGVVVLVALSALGWGLLAWRRPRVRGEA